MTNMPLQRSIVFTKPQWAWVEKEAKRLGISFSEVVRRAIDRVRDEK